MKNNSQIQLSKGLYLADIDGDKTDEFIRIEGNHLYAFRSDFDFSPILEHIFPIPVSNVIVGDFVKKGREHGRDQICVILQDGSLQSFAISNDLKSLWWWFSQPNFIAENEHFIVGDFDGDGADDLMIYNPLNGTIRFYSIEDGGIFVNNNKIVLGNLEGFDLRNKQILAGEFGQSVGRKDIIVIDKNTSQIMRFDSATDTSGRKTFWWAFTTHGDFNADDQLCVANIEGSEKDGLIIRNYKTGAYKIFKLELDNNLNLKPISTVSTGQLPIMPFQGKFVSAKIRSKTFRTEAGGEKRDDIIYFNEISGELISTDARFDVNNSMLTYWWSYSKSLHSNSAVFGVGDTIQIYCLGHIEGRRYLNGNTINTKVNLSSSSNFPTTGVSWKIEAASNGFFYLRCLGHIEGVRYLDGNTANGGIQLVSDKSLPHISRVDTVTWQDPPRMTMDSNGNMVLIPGQVHTEPRTIYPNRNMTGTLWRFIQVNNGNYHIRCEGHIEGVRYLDGDTVNGMVSLTKKLDFPNTGTLWKIVKMP